MEPRPPISGLAKRPSGVEPRVNGSRHPQIVPTGKSPNRYCKSPAHPPTRGQIRADAAEARKIPLLGHLAQPPRAVNTGSVNGAKRPFFSKLTLQQNPK